MKYHNTSFFEAKKRMHNLFRKFCLVMCQKLWFGIKSEVSLFFSRGYVFIFNWTWNVKYKLYIGIWNYSNAHSAIILSIRIKFPLASRKFYLRRQQYNKEPLLNFLFAFNMVYFLLLHDQHLMQFMALDKIRKWWFCFSSKNYHGWNSFLYWLGLDFWRNCNTTHHLLFPLKEQSLLFAYHLWG